MGSAAGADRGRHGDAGRTRERAGGRLRARTGRDRSGRTRAAEKAEEEKRQKNVAHQKMINREAMASLLHIAGIDESKAKAIIMAIANGKIANVFIKY